MSTKDDTTITVSHSLHTLGLHHLSAVLHTGTGILSLPVYMRIASLAIKIDPIYDSIPEIAKKHSEYEDLKTFWIDTWPYYKHITCYGDEKRDIASQLLYLDFFTDFTDFELNYNYPEAILQHNEFLNNNAVPSVSNGIDSPYASNIKDIPSVDFDEYVHSETCKPQLPPVYTSGVTIYNNIASITFNNMSGFQINEITFRLLMYNTSGSVYAAKKELIDNLPMLRTYIIHYPIDNGSSYTIDIDISKIMNKKNAILGVYVCSYNMTNNADYEYSPNQYYIYKSDGTAILPSDSAIPERLTRSELFPSGILASLDGNYLTVDPMQSNALNVPAGYLVLSPMFGELDENRILEPLDMIIRLGKYNLPCAHALQHAAQMLYESGELEIQYWRDNQIHTALIKSEDNSYSKADRSMPKENE